MSERRLTVKGQAKPEPPMSPKEHYVAASNMLTRSVDRITAMYGDEPVPAHLMQHITDRATAHAILATVPQAQFDAWHAEERTKARTKTPAVGDARCGMCGRLLYRVAENGWIELPPVARNWEWDGDRPLCTLDDPAGCGQQEPKATP